MRQATICKLANIKFSFCFKTENFNSIKTRNNKSFTKFMLC